MKLRTGALAVLLGGLITLGGMAVAGVAVVVALAAAPGLADQRAFLWASAVVAVVLHGGLGLAGAWFAGRRLVNDGIAAGELRSAVVVALAGPVAVTLLLQAGVAAGGEVLVSLVALLAAVGGGIAGGWAGFRGIGPAARGA